MPVFQNTRTLVERIWVKYIWYLHKLLGRKRAFLEREQTDNITESIRVANASEMYVGETTKSCWANEHGQGHTKHIRRQFRELWL